MTAHHYAPDVFTRQSMDEAKGIILLPECGLSTDERWERETAWLMPMLDFQDGLVIDFGCGIGRIAREMARPVLGVDISPTMRSQSDEYVHRGNFGAVTPVVLSALVDHGLQAVGAIAIWSLQHCANPTWDIELLGRAIRPGGRLIVLNRLQRVIPTTNDAGHFHWVDDGRDIDRTILTRFQMEEWITPPEDLCLPGAYLGIYRRY